MTLNLHSAIDNYARPMIGFLDNRVIYRNRLAKLLTFQTDTLDILLGDKNWHSLQGALLRNEHDWTAQSGLPHSLREATLIRTESGQYLQLTGQYNRDTDAEITTLCANLLANTGTLMGEQLGMIGLQLSQLSDLLKSLTPDTADSESSQMDPVALTIAQIKLGFTKLSRQALMQSSLAEADGGYEDASVFPFLEYLRSFTSRANQLLEAQEGECTLKVSIAQLPGSYHDIAFCRFPPEHLKRVYLSLLAMASDGEARGPREISITVEGTRDEFILYIPMENPQMPPAFTNLLSHEWNATRLTGEWLSMTHIKWTLEAYGGTLALDNPTSPGGLVLTLPRYTENFLPSLSSPESTDGVDLVDDKERIYLSSVLLPENFL